MKNKIIIPVLSMLLILGSCIYDAPVVDQVENEADDTYLSFRSTQITLPDNGTGTSVESITLNTLRILVFSKATGQIVTNEVFDISNRPVATKVGSNWVIDFSGIAVATKPGLSVVYVVLNEDVSMVGSQSLTAALVSLTNLVGMQALVNTPLSYAAPLRVTYQPDGITPNEPPFVMSTFDELDILPARPSTNPNLADLRGPSEGQKGFELDRTMAKVTIDSISSYPYTGGPTTNNVLTSYIFILKMGLVKVPQNYLWSPNRLQTNPPVSPTSPYPVPPYTSSYQSLNFNLEDPVKNYYNRTWGGSITATATANVTWVQTGQTSKRIYKIAGNAGSQSYSTTFNNHFESGTTPNINQGNFLTYIQSYFAGGAGTEFDPGNLQYTNVVVTPTVTGKYWTLNEKNISFYVPENILVNKSDTINSTKLYVKAAVASIELDPNNVEFNQNDVNWVKSGGEILWTYPTSTEIGNLSVTAFHYYSRSRYINGGNVINPLYVDVADDPGNLYIHFWDGSVFWRRATGTITTTLISPDFSKISNSTNTKEFYLPIKNTPETPVDHNIYRNHEYKFSVHVLQQWAPPAQQAVNNSSASTRSGDVTNSDASWNMVLKMNP